MHADHSKSRSRYGVGATVADRLLHATWNEQRGDGSHDEQRPTIRRVEHGPEWDPLLGRRVFDWP